MSKEVERKPIGGWVLSNFGGLTVESISNDGEFMDVRWYDEENVETCEIIYEVNPDTNDLKPCIEACINYHGTLYFLSNCMKY